MHYTNTEVDFSTFNALSTNIIVLNAEGKVLFANNAISHVLPEGDNEVTIFDLLQDHRLAEGLTEHIQKANKDEYVFTGLIKGNVYHFHVTKWNGYYICNGQSEDEIEQLYKLQVSSRKKMLEIKTKLLSICMLDKSEFDKALEQILASASEILNCERVSFWLVNEMRDRINCYMLYLHSLKGIAPKIDVAELTSTQSPAYFEHINREYAFVMADDIETHPATADFTESYSRPLNIKSLLDVPVWHNGRLYGIICCEQVGIRKKWQLEDVQFLLSLSDSTALCLQTRDRLETEKRLHETNQKLKRSNTDLEHFATVAAHDLKSPLRTMVSFLSLLKKQHSESLHDDAKEYVDYTMKNASHLTLLINDLLAYSKLEQQMGDMEDVEVQDLINQIGMDEAEFIAAKQGKIIVAKGLPILHINRNMLYRLFGNIVHNAIKYNNDDIAPVLEIGYRADSNFHYFEFADNGIGVDDEHAEKIFSLFGRLHGLDKYDGTGIGLAACKKIAELFGGKIIYKRRTNPAGSIFTVLLPLEYSAK